MSVFLGYYAPSRPARWWRRHAARGAATLHFLDDQRSVTGLTHPSRIPRRMRLLKEDQRQDAEALQTAVLGLVYRALENVA
jgi:hypothetical protein